MSAIRIQREISSETLHLPELSSFIGRKVDILIEDSPTQSGLSSSSDQWDQAIQAAKALHHAFDDAAIDVQSAADWEDAGQQPE